MKFGHIPLLHQLVCATLFGLLGFCVLPAHAETGLPEKAPDELGFSALRLARLPAFLHREIDAQHYAGVVWLVAREGGVVSHGAIGLRDVAAKQPMTEDTVFRIYSMSKIVTTVTALTLIEEGRLNLDDPVSRYLPEFAHAQVLVGGTANTPQLAPVERPITIRHLLTQTSGLPYEFFAGEPLKSLWVRAGIWHAPTLKEFVARAAQCPLAHQPGARWTYGISTDILGAVIEAVTGQDLETAMRERVFAPLGMNSTTFHPDAALQSRLATIYRRAPAGGLEPDRTWSVLSPLPFPSGGGGLFSTLHDYARFGQMLLNGGELDGQRVLGRKTVETMSSNQIAYLGRGDQWTPEGFGFGVRVRQADSARESALGSPGEFGWEGICTTYVSIDPKEHVLLVALLQHVPYDEDHIFEKFATTAYQALGR